jgi:hypothetical protein
MTPADFLALVETDLQLRPVPFDLPERWAKAFLVALAGRERRANLAALTLIGRATPGQGRAPWAATLRR